MLKNSIALLLTMVADDLGELPISLVLHMNRRGQLPHYLLGEWGFPSEGCPGDVLLVWHSEDSIPCHEHAWPDARVP